MPTRNVVLTEQQTHFVEQMVASGRYQNASEVLREGLRLVYQREQEELLKRQRSHSLPVVDTKNVTFAPLPDGAISLVQNRE